MGVFAIADDGPDIVDADGLDRFDTRRDDVEFAEFADEGVVDFRLLLPRLSLKLEFIIRATLLLAVCAAAETPEEDDSEGAVVAALAVVAGGRTDLGLA